MARTKPPVLTSPWKIGFFVSLMLVSVSIGVAYFFIRRFKISFEIGRIEPSLEWLKTEGLAMVLNPQGFVYQMAPVLIIVGATSIFSYVVITQAVRKYKRYLDSGLDYKNLLATIKRIDDLEDKSQIDRLKNHPDLKRFLMTMRDTVVAKRRELEEREKELQDDTKSTLQKQEELLGEQLEGQCNKLVGAIRAASSRGLPPNLELEKPELKRIADAVQEALQKAGHRAQSDFEDSMKALRKAGEMMRNKLTEFSDELRASSDGAKKIEKQLVELSGTEDGGAGALDRAQVRTVTQAIVGSSKTMDTLSASLDMLSEEAKGIAINTALQAGSGQASQSDLIQLAEDLKQIAARFNDVSRSYQNLTGELKGAISSLNAELAKLPSADSASRSSVGTIASKVSLWIERLVVVADKINNLRTSYDLALESVPSPAHRPQPEVEAASPEPQIETASDSFGVGDYGFETLGRDKPIFSDDDGADVTGEEPDVETEDSELFVEPPAAKKAPEPVEEEPQAEVELVSEEEPLTLDNEEDDSLFADLTDEGTAEPEETPAAAARGASLDPNGVELESPADIVSGRKKDDDLDDLLPPIEEEGVPDLYALGAVDYDPALHG